MSDLRMRPSFLIAASIVLVLLMAGIFGLTSLNLPFISPSGTTQTILLFVLSTIIFLSFLVLGFILFRSFLKLYLERRANQLGSKFKTKLVCGALGLSLLPVFFLFLFSYSLVNRTLDKWFSSPFEKVSRETGRIVEALDGFVRSQADAEARRVALELEAAATEGELRQRFTALPASGRADYIAVLDAAGNILMERRFREGLPDFVSPPPQPRLESSNEISSELVEQETGSYALVRMPLAMPGGETATVVVGTVMPAVVSESAARLKQESALYGELSREKRFLRSIYLSILFLLTLMILFIATWFALFLSRQITVPIQALAEATHEVSRGNLGYRVNARAADELGILVRSFNEMTEQLAAGREELERSSRHLEQMNAQLEERRRFTEAILESIPTGVVSVSGKGDILAANSAARRLFGRDPVEAGELSNLFLAEDSRELRYLMKRASRMGQATRQMELRMDGRPVKLAVTVAALAGEPPGPYGGPRDAQGFVVVLEDMSELLRAQKAAAWGEVAQRIAHEIKNPLTPIALSAERIHLWLRRREAAGNDAPALSRVVQESCALIRQEVGNLKRLVDEFSQFSRFPKACPVPGNLNEIIQSALGLFDGRLEGIRIRTQFASDLPLTPVDRGQFRRVIVNLIDNAAEAMENSLLRELSIATRFDARREVVETVVADTGPGVSREEKEKLFLPYFSTKERGTGLGLAIASRIVNEHEGTIRVEENQPTGTRFIIELPLRATAVTVSATPDPEAISS